MIMNLKIYDTFENLILPLNKQEILNLSKSTGQENIEPIFTWNNYILNGKETYELCTKYKIPFKVNRLDFSSEEEAIIWICNKQLERENLNEKSVRFLIGNLYIAHRKIINHHCCKDDRKNELLEISTKLAIKHKLKRFSIYRYTAVAIALNRIQSVNPDLFYNIILAKYKISDTNVIKISKINPIELNELNKKLSTTPNSLYSYINTKTTKKVKSLPTKNIKDMPDYDPDARLQELYLTMPSWINSLERAKNNINIKEVSKKATNELLKNLNMLIKKTNEIIIFIKEK